EHLVGAITTRGKFGELSDRMFSIVNDDMKREIDQRICEAIDSVALGHLGKWLIGFTTDHPDISRDAPHGGKPRVFPHALAVEMYMGIDNPGHHQQAAGIDHTARGGKFRTLSIPDDDARTGHADAARKLPLSIDKRTILDQEIEHRQARK